MNFFRRITDQKLLEKYFFLFLALFLINNSIAIPLVESSNMSKSDETDIKFKELFTYDSDNFSKYDRFENQLRIFFGADSENPEKNFYPDLSIIDDSQYIRELYGKKLKDMTTNKKIYIINK